MLRKPSLKNMPSNFGSISCLVTAVYSIYHYVLLESKLLPFSISAILSWADQRHYHVLAVGLLPIYLALMIFGTAIMSVYLGSVIQRWLQKLTVSNKQYSFTQSYKIPSISYKDNMLIK